MIESTSGLLISLRKRRDQLRRELIALDSLIATYEALTQEQASESPSESDQFELYRARPSRAAQTAAIAESMEAARKIILRSGRPMKRGELARELGKMGFDLPGGDKNKVLGTNIWRSGKFRVIDGLGYWPKDVPFSKA